MYAAICMYPLVMSLALHLCDCIHDNIGLTCAAPGF